VCASQLLQQEVAPLTSGRLSHSSGPLNGGGSLSDSPPVSPEIDDAKVSPESRRLLSPRRLVVGGVLDVRATGFSADCF
jgi:hypothetical protein